ncbi:FTR1 family protein [Gordonia sp. PP30]|uniref:iron uptake transporter permease EfeU n=1 Tax=unclassified Gordonia (in: high G+C Gram-positive bacteria) TaxID=2657482 RepID=UPI001FFF14F6|nr:iron uptake transporter permease EfeU [Gordonia sp. PP30]UQE75980.1 FTR1 family protein [Gordonia sp. PP30]
MTILAEGTPSVVTQMFGSGLIGVREGLEAGIVVMVLIAFAAKSDRRDALKWIWAGVAAALTMTIGTFLIIQFGTSTISSLTAELIAGIASLVAVVIVTSMLLWMRKASAHISGDLKSGLSSALEIGGIAVFGLAFLAVGREGFETALLMVGYAESVSGGLWPLMGLLLGILIAALLTALLYYGAISINFSKFFTYTGLFLVIVAAGILSYGVHALQVYGWLPGHGAVAYDISATYDASSWYGVILSGIFNFSPNPSWLQVIAWILYVAIVTPLFLLRGRTPSRKEVADGATV